MASDPRSIEPAPLRTTQDLADNAADADRPVEGRPADRTATDASPVDVDGRVRAPDRSPAPGSELDGWDADLEAPGAGAASDASAIAASATPAEPGVHPEPGVRAAPDPLPEAQPGTASAAASGADAAAAAALDRDVVVVMHDVAHRFDDREVLSGINLTVPRGTILGIIGPSGAGKTTTIRMLTGAIAPTTGEVSVLGTPPKKFRRAHRERIGYMPQSFTLYEDLTAGENVDFVASLFGMLFRRRRRRVQEVLKVVDLWDARGRQAGRLSGGMQRRLELACALVHEPELIILDEPTAGIDPLLRGSIWEELHALRDAGRTLLVTTQHVSEADECDAVAMIVGGRIIALAPPDELRRIATNGDLLDIETTGLFDGSALMGTPGVREVSQDGPRHLRVVVDDAGSLLPVVVERIKAAGGEVESAREHRLSFDEIFAILVARNERERAAEDDADGGGGRPTPGTREVAA